MRLSAALLLVSAMSVAACEAGPGPTSLPPRDTTTSAAPTTTQTTAPEEVYSFSYSLRTGETLAYRIDFSRRLRLEAQDEGDGPARDLPASADLALEGSGVFTFDVEPGPEPGTFLLVVGGEPERVDVEGTIDGETVTGEEAVEQLSGAVRIPAQMVIDATGRLLTPAPVGLELLPPLLAAPGFLGPVWPEGEVTSEWTFSHPDRVMDVVEIEREVRGRVVGEEQVGPVRAQVVEGRSMAGEVEADLTRFYRDFLAAFGTGGADPRLTVRAEPSELRWTAWFDPETARLVQVESRTGRRTVLEGTAPSDSERLSDLALTIEVEDRLDAAATPAPGD